VHENPFTKGSVVVISRMIPEKGEWMKGLIPEQVCSRCQRDQDMGLMIRGIPLRLRLRRTWKAKYFELRIYKIIPGKIEKLGRRQDRTWGTGPQAGKQR